MCCAGGRKHLGLDFPQHCWVEFPGGSTGYGPGDSSEWGTRGKVAWPRDPYGSSSSESCIPIKISPCVFDIDKFVKCVSSKPEGECVGQICGEYDVYNRGFYQWAFNNCVQYSHKLVGSCGAKSLR